MLPSARTQNATVLKQRVTALFSEKQYEESLQLYLQYNELKPGDAESLAHTGICYFETNDLGSAESVLRQAVTNNASLPTDAYLYLAKVYHARLAFEDAVRMYKVFLKNAPRDHPLRAAVKDDIRRCATGMRVLRNPLEATVMNLGNTINSAGDEIRPLLSPNDLKRMYFSSFRPGNAGCDGSSSCGSDMYFTELENGDWQPPRRLSVFLNTIENEVALDFRKEGAELYFFRGETRFSGDILVDTFREDVTGRTLFSKEFSGPMRAWEGDCAPFFFNDTILLFASRRAGGSGGLDLYVSSLRNGEWTTAQNLGPSINSIYDDSSPFLAADGRTLWFSTNDPRRSFGGSDIVRSTYLDKTMSWLPPQNPGPPLNSAGDDIDFLLSPDGSRAFISSSRKEGQGGQDLYVALFGKPRNEEISTQMPVAFYLVPVYRSALTGASEATVAPEDIFTGSEPVTLSPLYYGTGGRVVTTNLRDLQVLSQLMKNWPQAKIILAAHCDPSNPTPQTGQDILPGVLDSLRLWEVPLDNLVLRYLGAAKLLDADAPAENRRVDIFIPNLNELPVGIHLTRPATTDPGEVFFRKAMEGLYYQVQVPLDDGVSLDDLFRSYPDGCFEQSPAGGTSYFGVGMFLTYQSAEQWRRELTERGYPRAEVSAFVKGWKVSKAEAGKLMEKFPDLMNYARQ